MPSYSDQARPSETRGMEFSPLRRGQEKHLAQRPSHPTFFFFFFFVFLSNPSQAERFLCISNRAYNGVPYGSPETDGRINKIKIKRSRFRKTLRPVYNFAAPSCRNFTRSFPPHRGAINSPHGDPAGLRVRLKFHICNIMYFSIRMPAREARWPLASQLPR